MPKQQPSHPWQQPLTQPRHTPETVARVISAVASASSAEVAVALGLTRNAVCGILSRARTRGEVVVCKHRPSTPKPVETPAPKKTVVPKVVPELRVKTPKQVYKPGVPELPQKIKPVASFGTGVSVLDVRHGQCRALDDRRECCCAPVVPGSSWCAGHRALYVAGARRAA